jgi:hypothetical protein
MAYFENLYSFSTSKGIVIPDTGAVKLEVERTFKENLGANLDVSQYTPAGRMIEALTVLFVNILGVNAQNANSLNPNRANGTWLDAIGMLFGIVRLTGESDYLYRNRILNSHSRGSGYVQSIWNAVGNVDGVTSVCVLENGFADPLVLPDADNGIAIDPHSIFVCVNGGNDEDVARAIYSTKSAGCAYHNETALPPENKVSVILTDEPTNTATQVIFYRPIRRYVRFFATIRSDAYTGVDIIGDTKRVISEFMSKHDANSVVTKADLITAIGGAGLGLVCTNMVIEVSENGDIWFVPDGEQLTLRPYQFVIVSEESTEVILA